MSLSSQSNKTENLPPTARAIALILSSTPSVQDAQPGVLHQLLEFANRYTQHVLTDARVYAEHRQGAEGNKVEAEDVVLAVQARVGWEFGGRVPAEYIQSLATQTNSIPLPSVPEVFGVRLPPQSECLTAIDFDLVPNKPPPGIKIFDEEIEEIEESEEEEDEDEDMDMEPAPIPDRDYSAPEQRMSPEVEQAPFPITAAAPFEDVMPTSKPGEASDDDEDGLFAGGDDDSDADAMEEVQTEETTRKLVETDDYD